MHSVTTRPMAAGKAEGVSVKWDGGQFCLIVTDRGFVGCGIFSPEVMEKFAMAGALARGTPEKPLVEPEDLLTAKISVVSSGAARLGIREGMTGEQALARLLAG